MDALSRWVLTFVFNSIWQMALVVAAAALADVVLRRSLARYRHALWVLALAAAVVLPAVSTRTFEAPSVSARAAAQIPVLSTVPVPTLADSGIVVRAGERRTRVNIVRRVLLAGAHRSVALSRPMMRVLLILYWAFLTLALIRFLRAWLRARSARRLADARPLPDDVVSTVERCLRTMPRGSWSRFSPKPSVLWSDEVPGPVTVGALRGAIILPKHLIEQGAHEDLEAALAHEMAHVCRRDYLWNLICELLLVPVAFHPLTRLLRRSVAEARELACDELAARTLDPSHYARSLVRMANEISRRASMAFKLDYTLGVFDANILEERVMTLLKPRASGRLAKPSVLLGALVIASSCLLASRFSLGVGQASSTSSVATASSGNQITKYPGTLNGVAGGVSGGVPGGVAGGLVTMPGRARAQGAAQTGANSLSGIVVDTSGARVPKATVWLVNRDSGARQDAETDETGGFAFRDLPAGRYTLNVISQGMGGSFRMFTLKGEGQPPFFPFVLQPGQIAASAVVTAKLPPGVPVKSATPAGPRRIRIGGMVEGSKLIEDSPQPLYPESARERGIQGLVLLEATISAEGMPTDLKVLSSPSDDLSQASMDAVKQWRYRSTLLNGEPISVLTTIAVDFRLED